MLGGYTWNAKVLEQKKEIQLDVYLFVSALRKIALPDGSTASVKLSTEMPWNGQATFDLAAPEGWTWKVNLPRPSYGDNFHISTPSEPGSNGYHTTSVTASGSIEMTFDLPVHLLSSHPLTGQDTLTVKRGPIVYTAESVDNPQLEKRFPHFEGVGIRSTARFIETELEIEGIPVVSLTTEEGEVYAEEHLGSRPAYSPVNVKNPARRWTRQPGALVLVPWFARANRGGAGHVRTSFLRVN